MVEGSGGYNEMRDERDIWEKGSREKGRLKRRSYRGGLDGGGEGRSWFSVEGALSLR